ncbi:hypothetical protein BC828DRAFT_382603 [Blastocladiella britannica]|nr:hypothetical protein BC828DRAFT_382603 [Blastocladiella britannica]
MPFKYTEYALTAASGGGFVDILSWFGQAHTAHGLELKYAAAAIDDASAAGFIPVLEWWLSAASRYRLELRYSADAVNAAARARRWDVLAWWRRAAESNPSIITLKYDPAALSAPARTALGLPMLTSGTSSTPTLPTRSPTLMSRPTLSGFGSADYPTPLPQSLPLEPQTPIAAGPPQPLRAASSSSTYPGLMSPPPYASFSSSTPAASLAPTSGYPGHHRPVSVPATPMETSTSAYLLTPVVMVEPEPEVPVRQLNWWQRQTTGGKIVMVVAVLWIIGASSSNEYWTIGILAAALMVYWYCARRNS